MLREIVKFDTYDYVILYSGQDVSLISDLNSFLENGKGGILIDSGEDNKHRRAFLFYYWSHNYFE